MPINIGKLKFVDFIKASTSVSVQFTFETSFIEMPTIVDYKFVAQDIKFGEYIALVNRTTGNNFDQNNHIYRLFQNVHPILKFNFD